MTTLTTLVFSILLACLIMAYVVSKVESYKDRLHLEEHNRRKAEFEIKYGSTGRKFV